MAVDTVDTIKARLIRNASKLWGYPDIQDINSFDPVLGLIMGALAEELHNISREINNTDFRIIGKFMELLFNQNIFTHFPAHSIVCARPLQPRVKINDLYHFYYSKDVSIEKNREGTVVKKDIYFTPTANFTLFNGEVKYLLAGKYLYEINGMLKEIIGESHSAINVSNSKISIGIKLDPLVDDIDGLSLYFSFRNIRSEDRLYHLLHNAVWKINGREAVFQNGMYSGLTDRGNSLHTLLKKAGNITFKTISYINDFYNKRFMILDKKDYHRKDFIGNTPYFPATFIQENKLLNNDNNELLWIEIELAQPLSPEDINDLIVNLNSFPVLNRELNEYTHSVIKGTNVIPIITDDLFFDMNRVTDSKETLYTQFVAGGEERPDNSYMIRQGGITRFDSSGARQSIKHLLDLVRDEAAAFAVKGTDLISYELKQLDQILTRLEQRVGSSGVADDLNPCLILESGSEYEKINVQYWTIAGEPANNIRPGSKLTVYRGVDIDDKSITLITQTIGGKHKLTREEMLNTLRRSILSRGRIVTNEDIKALCYEIFSERLQSVEVKKGVSAVNPYGKGMMRTMDIYLKLKEGTDLSSYNIWQQTENLKTSLKRDSVNLLPYRIFVK